MFLMLDSQDLKFILYGKKVIIIIFLMKLQMN
ncbi:hypothetical protein YTXLTZUM_CDS0092 [Enterococcus phage VRE9_3]